MYIRLHWKVKNLLQFQIESFCRAQISAGGVPENSGYFGIKIWFIAIPPNNVICSIGQTPPT